MRACDIQLGQRVQRRSGESSFVPERRAARTSGSWGLGGLQRRRVGVVVGMPEQVQRRQLSVRVQWEGSSCTELVMVHRLELAPQEPVPVAAAAAA